MTIFIIEYLIPILAIYCCQYAYAIDSSNNHVSGSGNNTHFRNLPCPNPEDIAPCICTYYEEADDAMDMYCSEVSDDQELYDVFHTSIPFPIFRKLDLGQHNGMNELSDAMFGEATFEDVIAINNYITYIGADTFIKSVDTLRFLTLYGNDLTDFPFSTLSKYKKLEKLYIEYNPIPSFPVIYSETLRVLTLGGPDSLIHEVPSGVLDGLPNLAWFGMENTPLDFLAKDVFKNLPLIETLDFRHTGLQHLESLQFHFNSTRLHKIYLDNNDIDTVEPDTFKGRHAGYLKIDLRWNKLTLFTEAVWKPLLEDGVTLLFDGNELTCGCDIAWLVLEPTYHQLVEDALCHSGELVVELDPHFFETFC